MASRAVPDPDVPSPALRAAALLILGAGALVLLPLLALPAEAAPAKAAAKSAAKAAPAPAPAPAPAEEPEADADPLAELAEVDPELAAALTAHGEGDALAAAAAVALAADARLRDLLLPPAPVGPYPDRRGEDLRVDLVAADVVLDGTVLRGSVAGVGAADNGVWLQLDTRGGPAPDLLLGFGRGWSREATIDGGAPSPMLARDVLPEVGQDVVHFAVDLAGSARFDAAHAGRATAFIKSFDGRVVDVGPGGFLGPAPEEALEVLMALVEAGPVADADLAVALAITFGAARATVAEPALAQVDADAVAWLRHGEGLDAWLEEVGADWRFGDRDAFAKLVWAWPAAQTVAYGQFAFAQQVEPLTAERWRFDVPGAAELAALRDLAPRMHGAADTADAIDAWVWKSMDYRTNEPLMRSFCRDGTVSDEVCEAWSQEQIHGGGSVGRFAGVDIPLDQGVSAQAQLRRRAQTGRFVGDCATATSLAIWALQAIGIPAIGMGWAGTDTSTPTHDVPLWLDGGTFRATQTGPARTWAAETAFVYVTLPGVHPVNTFALAREPNGWSRGGAVVGGWTRFDEVRRILAQGLPAELVGGWVDVQAAGGWPTW